MSKRVFLVLAALVAPVAAWSTLERFTMIQPLALANPVQNVTVEQVLIRNNRRIPESTVKIWIGTREGDPYNPVQLDERTDDAPQSSRLPSSMQSVRRPEENLCAAGRARSRGKRVT